MIGFIKQDFLKERGSKQNFAHKEGGWSKRGGLKPFCILRGGLAKKRGVTFLWGGFIPWCPLCCYNFCFSNELTKMANSHSPALLDLFLSSNTSICSTMAFPPLGNSDHVFVSVSIDFPSTSKWDAPFHHIAYNYFCADWDSLCDHLRDVPWEDIFNLGAFAASEFC